MKTPPSTDLLLIGSPEIDKVILQGIEWHIKNGNADTGITYIIDGVVFHWEKGERLRNPSALPVGAFAVHHDGVAWLAFGEFDKHSDNGDALGWQRVWLTQKTSDKLRLEINS